MIELMSLNQKICQTSQKTINGLSLQVGQLSQSIYLFNKLSSLLVGHELYKFLSFFTNRRKTQEKDQRNTAFLLLLSLLGAC